MTGVQTCALPISESLAVIFGGAIIVVPTILCYTVFLYRVFGGKAQPLRYEQED